MIMIISGEQRTLGDVVVGIEEFRVGFRDEVCMGVMYVCILAYVYVQVSQQLDDIASPKTTTSSDLG